VIVVDASVLAKLYLPEDGSDAALALLRAQPRLLAPSLIRLEVAAAICRHVRKGLLPAADAEQKCQAWFQLLKTDAVELLSDDELTNGAIHLSVTLAHPLQDCLYLEAMRKVNGTLITADRKFHTRVAPVYVDVRLLDPTMENISERTGKQYGA